MTKDWTSFKYYLLGFVIITFLNIRGQNSLGCWTWIGGVQQTNNYGGSFGTKGVPSTTNKVPGLYEAVEWQDSQGNFWLYGGANFVHGWYDNMWRYDLSTKQWTWMSGSGLANQNPKYGLKGVPSVTNSPGFRSTSYSWVDKSGKFWLFGGIASYTAMPGGGIPYGDLWKYDPGNNTWVWMKGPQYYSNAGVYGVQGVEDSLNYPPPQSEMGICWTDDVSGNLWLVTSNGCLWKYNVTTNNWTWMKGNNIQASPNAVYGVKNVPALSNTPGTTNFDFTRWKDSNGDFWYLYSGATLWRYQIQNNCWTWMWGDTTIADTHNYGIVKCDTSEKFIEPNRRSESRACWVDNCDNLWLMGGFSNTSTSYSVLNDLMFYNTKKNQWTWAAGDSVQKNTSSFGVLNVSNPNNYPSSRSGAHPFKDLQGNLGLFGGAAYDNYSCLADLWLFTPDSTCTGCQNQSSPMAIKDNSDKNYLRPPMILPNPSNGHFEIRNIDHVSEIRIYEVTGEMIFQKKIITPTMEFDLHVSGIFTVELISSSGRQILKLVVTE